MKLTKKTCLKVSIGILLTILIFLVGIVSVLSSESFQLWLYAKGIEMLSEKLGTRVKVDRMTFDYRRGGVALYGFEMDDLQHVTMLKVDTLEAGIELLPLLRREVDIDAVYLHGVKAVLYKERPDTAANYQFVLNAFKTKKAKASQEPHEAKGSLELSAHLEKLSIARAEFLWDVKSLPRKEKGKLDVHHLNVHNFSIEMSGDISTISSHQLENSQKPADSELKGKVKITHLSASELSSGTTLSLKSIHFRTNAEKGTKTKLQDVHLSLPGKELTVHELTVIKKGNLRDLTNEEGNITVKGLNYQTNNGKPRKNVGRPHRGAFDVGHLNVDANLTATIHSIKKGFLSLSVNSLDAIDHGSGLIIKNLTTDVEKKDSDIFFRNTKIASSNTSLSLGTTHITLTPAPRNQNPESRPQTPDPRTQNPESRNQKSSLTIFPVHVTATVDLRDIARPFAPVLDKFSTQLQLKVTCSGNADRILFKNIHVTTPDKRLNLHAQGDLCNVTKKELLCLHFWDINMSARNGIKEQIIGHFAKKINLKMQRQMRLLGNIRYNGKLGIFHKREDISGTLFSKFGDVNFAFTIDGLTKYMTGTLQAVDFEVGKLMNVSHLRPLSVYAEYSFKTSAKKGKKKRGKGKLPVGTLSAKVDGARYGIISMKHITADFVSDGETAQGTIIAHKKLFDIAIDVSYHQTTDDQSMHYKVRLQKPTK